MSEMTEHIAWFN